MTAVAAACEPLALADYIIRISRFCKHIMRHLAPSMAPSLGGSVLPRGLCPARAPLARPRHLRARAVPRAVAAPERLPAPAPSSNGNGNGASSSSAGSLALVPATAAVGESALEKQNDAFSFDENAPIVAEAPGGEWSRFRYYGVVAVRVVGEQPYDTSGSQLSPSPPANHRNLELRIHVRVEARVSGPEVDVFRKVQRGEEEGAPAEPRNLAAPGPAEAGAHLHQGACCCSLRRGAA